MPTETTAAGQLLKSLHAPRQSSFRGLIMSIRMEIPITETTPEGRVHIGIFTDGWRKYATWLPDWLIICPGGYPPPTLPDSYISRQIYDEVVGRLRQFGIKSLHGVTTTKPRAAVSTRLN